MKHILTNTDSTSPPEPADAILDWAVSKVSDAINEPRKS